MFGQTSLQDGVDGFGGGGHRESHLVHCAIGPSTNVGPSELNVRENKRPQPGMVAEKTLSHCPPQGLAGGLTLTVYLFPLLELV